MGAEVLSFLLKAVVSVVLLVLYYRFMGRKELAQVTALDLAYVIILSDVFSTGIIDEAVKWHDIAYKSFLWILIIYLIEKVTYRSRKLSQWMNGEPQVVIHKGEVNEMVLQKERISEEELEAKMRILGYFTYEDIDIAYLEVNGEISVKKAERG